METLKKAPGNNKMIVVGINLLVLVAYTIYFRWIVNEELIILAEAVFIFLHVLLCLIVAIFALRKEFLFSALVVLLIGFSSCWVVFSI
ncbi:hypothetical protein SAMN05192574_104208 [Mucilaginibacter gossypiicola]|uniref:Uncharacterized protein n=1 Tax=Mucilaginibacter gossypiicola TaxID=551995 RepID=A0A1H8JKB9_9SPHI|nr:hypothetical protein [Mucilaginibacter gossypiicola]SEN80707.1 hypothetical protein SAMN05192574_104208 [Mucilaginibacter gossypiicola]